MAFLVSPVKVSVIIPTFNRADLLPRALDSIHSQELGGANIELEIIVVDDGSTDATEDLVAQRYSNIRYVKQSQRGVSAARNAGLRHADGEWVALLDSDDEWLPHKLTTQLRVLEDRGLKICHTEEIWVRNGVRVNQMNKHKKSGGDVFERCLPLCAMSPSSILIHRDVFDHIGVFDETLPACEDYDLWLRMAAHYPVTFVERPSIIKYGGHDDQLSRAFWGMDRFRVIALEKLLNQPVANLQLNSEQYDQALSVLSKKNGILLNGAKKHQNNELVSECETRAAKFSLTG